MQTASKPFQTFEDLDVYKSAREFRKTMYGVNRRLPNFEKFELGSQIRTASVSLTNNIAEGHGRFHYLDQIKFMLQSRGSLQEPMDDLNICLDESYISADEIAALRDQGWDVLRLLNGYLRWLRARKVSQTAALQEQPTQYGDTDEDLETGLPRFRCNFKRSKPLDAARCNHVTFETM